MGVLCLATGQFSFTGVSNTGQRCTDVQVNTPECRMMAHNEDWIKDLAGKCFVVDVTINKNDVTQDLDASTGKFDDVSTSLTEIQRTIFQRNERFVSYVTPGDLPGFNYAMNKNFVITINSQMPLQMNTGAVPLVVLLRALLACDTIGEYCLRESTVLSNTLRKNRVHSFFKFC